MSSSLSPSRDRYSSFHLVDQENEKTKQDPESAHSVPNQVLLTNLFSVSKTSSLEPTPTENRPSRVFASIYPTVQQMYKPTLLSHATPSEKVYVPTEKSEEPATPTVSQMYQPTLLSHPSVSTSISTSETPFPPTQASENLEFASVSPTDTSEEEDLDSLSSADDSEDADLDSSSSSSPTVSQMWESTVFVRSSPNARTREVQQAPNPEEGQKTTQKEATRRSQRAFLHAQSPAAQPNERRDSLCRSSARRVLDAAAKQRGGVLGQSLHASHGLEAKTQEHELLDERERDVQSAAR